jgi:hypothetical protein
VHDVLPLDHDAPALVASEGVQRIGGIGVEMLKVMEGPEALLSAETFLPVGLLACLQQRVAARALRLIAGT